MASLTVLDITVLMALAVGLVTGFVRGFVQEILSLGALLLALLVLRYGHGLLTDTVGDFIDNQSAASLVAFLLIMILVWGGGKMIARRIGSATRDSVLGPFDRILGAGFGLVKALLIFAAGFMLLTMLYDLTFGPRADRPRMMVESRTYPLLRAAGAALSSIIAERLDTRTEPGQPADGAPDVADPAPDAAPDAASDRPR